MVYPERNIDDNLPQIEDNIPFWVLNISFRVLNISFRVYLFPFRVLDLRQIVFKDPFLVDVARFKNITERIRGDDRQMA